MNTEKFWSTGDAAAAQGWTALVVDTNGNGRRDGGYNEPGQSLDPSKDTHIPFGLYGISVSPLEGSIWGSSLPHPVISSASIPDRTRPTRRSPSLQGAAAGYDIRGMDVDRTGVVWVPLNSGHIGSFDRRKCKGPLNGPGAETGDECPEGCWSFYPLPGAAAARRHRCGREPSLSLGRSA